MNDGTAFGTAWPITGRDTELRALSAAFDDQNCGGVAFIGGAGFGKTRLANRALGMAQERGMAWTSVRATKSATSIPFAALAPLFVELDLPSESDAGLFRAAAEAIDRRRGDQRMALIIDDAQELDEASAALLDQLADRGGIFIVFTVRLGDRDIATITRMWKDQQILRIEIGPLPARDLRTLAQIAVGGPVDGGSLQAIVDASQGNVLFLRELIQGAMESGSLSSELGLWRLNGSLAHSPRLRDLVEQRLTGLQDQEREALELVALGDPLGLEFLERLVPLEAIEGLERRGLVDVLDNGDGPELHLNHPLYGDVVRAQLPSIRRIRLSRSLADAAEAQGSVEGQEALRVAVWRLDGGGEGRLDTTVAAARRARRSEDYALAVRLGESAWRRWKSVDAALILGDSLDFLGRCREAEEVLGAAEPLATNDRQRTSLAVRRAAALFRSLGEAGRADKVIEDAATVVTDLSCRRQLDALRGNNLLLSGDVARAIAVDEGILLQSGDGAFAQASLDVGTALALAGRTQEAIEHTAAALAVRIDLDDEEQLSAVGIYLVAQALAKFYSGDLKGARAICDAGYQVSVDKSNLDGQAWFASISGLVLFTQGLLVASGHMFREAAFLFTQLNHPGRRWGLGGIALTGAHTGNLDAAEAAIVELDEMEPTAVHIQDIAILRGRAWTAFVRGEISAARQILWDAVEMGEGWGQFATCAEALHDLVRMGDANPATEHLERISHLVDGAFMDARLSFCRAIQRGDVDLATEAADRFEGVGAMLFAAEAASVEAELAGTSGLQRRGISRRGTIDTVPRRLRGGPNPLDVPATVGDTALRERARGSPLGGPGDEQQGDCREAFRLGAHSG